MTDIAKINGVAAASVGKHLGVASANIAKVGGADFPGGFVYPYPVDNSAMFSAVDSTYMTYTPGAAGNQKTNTFSCWWKMNKYNTTPSNINALLAINEGTGGMGIFIYGNFMFYTQEKTFGAARYKYMTTTALYRDYSAWNNVVVRKDFTQAATADRMTLWINGVEITDLSTDTDTTNQNDDMLCLSADVHTMGRQHQYTRHNDMLVAEHCCCDGQAYTADDFGEFVNGIWVPKDISGLTFGTRGWRMNFADSADLGKDVSGGGNDWATYNMGTEHQSTDTPTNNFATLNPLDFNDGIGSLTEGNLKVTASTTSWPNTPANFVMEQGKWYMEVKIVNRTNTSSGVGLFIPGEFNLLDETSDKLYQTYVYWANGSFYGHTVLTGTGDTYTTGDIVMIAVDVDAAKIWYGKNGVWQDSGNPGAGTNEASLLTGSDRWTFGIANYNGEIYAANFGGTNIFTISSGNADDNGYGNFEYAPPTGFMALCSANLQDSAGTDPVAGEAVSDSCVKAIAYAGTGASNPIIGAGFQPDLVIILGNDGTKECAWYSSVRGVGKYIDSYYPNTHIAEVTDAQSLTSFDADGFTLGTSSASNGNGSDYVAYCFKKGAAYGVDVVEYTGTGSARTVAHSLGVPPEAMFVKNVTVNREIVLYHEGSAADAETDYTLLDVNTSFTDDSTMWNDTAPDAANFTVGTNDYTNESGQTHIAFLFASIDGVSSFGSFEGNANVDGPFVYTGFRPEIFWSFRAESTNNYICSTDKALQPDNPTGDTYIYINAGMGTGHASFTRDMVSNGYKIRTNNATYNGAITHVYFAWAAQPFKYANAR